jgi:hypothetical protein
MFVLLIECSRSRHNQRDTVMLIVYGEATIAVDTRDRNIMTFMVDQDLGPNTTQLAAKIDAFVPDQCWTKVD